MSINPGVPKHPIINSTFSKLASLREFLDNVSSDKEIGLDGGVDFNNMKRLYELGANVLVGGSGTIFSNLYDVRENIREVMKIKKGN
jgi:ribulose-phosphate 3-epimerase